MTILLNNISGAAVESEELSVEGGSLIVNVRADDFDAGAVLIQLASEQDPNDRFITIPNGTFAASSSVKIDYLAKGLKIKAVLSGSSGSAVNVFCDVLQ